MTDHPTKAKSIGSLMGIFPGVGYSDHFLLQKRLLQEKSDW